MDRLTAQAALHAISHSQQADQTRRGAPQPDPARDLAQGLARRLQSELAPLFPSVAAAARSDAAAQVWIEAWGRQIAAAGLQPAELAEGLKNIAAVMQAAGHPPLSFPLFLQACRPTGHLTGQDAEARKPLPPLVERDLLKDQKWCAARDKAIARLRGMGYCLPSKS